MISFRPNGWPKPLAILVFERPALWPFSSDVSSLQKSIISGSTGTARPLATRSLIRKLRRRVRTANGIAAVAPVTLREVTVGSIYMGDVRALVADRSAGDINLLGMSFLQRLAGVEQKSGRLVLRQ